MNHNNEGESLTVGDWLPYCSGACVINLGASMLLTGGGHGGARRVSEYSEAGFLRDLPALVEARWYHGCSYYHNQEGEMVFLVTGGLHQPGGRYELRSSTELLGEAGKAWLLAGHLPAPTAALRGVNMEGTVLMTGERRQSTVY